MKTLLVWLIDLLASYVDEALWIEEDTTEDGQA